MASTSSGKRSRLHLNAKLCRVHHSSWSTLLLWKACQSSTPHGCKKLWKTAAPLIGAGQTGSSFALVFHALI